MTSTSTSSATAAVIEPSPTHIPAELKALQQWVLWRLEPRGRGEKPSKIPYAVSGKQKAAANDPTTWSGFRPVGVAYLKSQKSKRPFSGVGFVFSDGDELSGIDLDNSLNDDGTVKTWAQEIIARFGSYTEVSPSGRGVKIWIHGKLPANWKGINEPYETGAVEIYSRGRYFAMTGRPLQGCPTEIANRQDELIALYEKVKSQANGHATEYYFDGAIGTNGNGRHRNGRRLTVAERAKLYVEKLPPAISGQDGHGATFHMACVLVVDFALTFDEAWPIALEYNERCEPPWSESDLARKLHEAEKQSGQRGKLRDAGGVPPGAGQMERRVDQHGDAGLWFDITLPENRTEARNAERFAALYGKDARWCDPWKKWLTWDGCRWALDDSCTVEGWAKLIGHRLWGDVAAQVAEHEKLPADLVSFARVSSSAAGVRNMLSLARSEPGIAASPRLFDVDPMLLNVKNGTLDLRTGELRQHSRTDLLTKLAPVEFEPGAKCPLWLETISKIFGGKQTLVGFIQRLLGYCLTGDVREHALPILWGAGSNGKSTILETIIALMGDYAGRTAPDLLLSRKVGSHPTELADLFGKRLVVANETDEGRRLAESLVKDLTGGDRVKARRMKEDFWEFSPSHKLVVCTNHRPEVRGTDHGIWRRILLVPFVVKFWNPDKGEDGPDELRVDTELVAKLKGELAGILTWCIEGCLAWQRYGLVVPGEVQAATEEYRQQEDVLGAFIAACCVVDYHARAPSTELFKAYQAYSGDQHMNQTKFARLLTARGFHNDRITAGKQKGRMAWFGVGLIGNASEGSEGIEGF